MVQFMSTRAIWVLAALALPMLASPSRLYVGAAKLGAVALRVRGNARRQFGLKRHQAAPN